MRGGTIELAGAPITKLAAHTLVERGIGYVPQRDNVFTALTVEENLKMGLYLRPREWAAEAA